MKHYLAFVIFLAFCKASKIDLLQKAFVGISKALAKRNHLLSVVTDGFTNDKVNSATFAVLNEIPHVIIKFENRREKIQLNSSAIVLLDSVATFETFRNHT